MPLKDIDDREMPLLEHLLELRTRLMYSALAIFVAFVVAYFFSDDIFWILARPLARAQAAAGETDPKMVYTALTEFFFTRVRIAFWAGFFIAFPVVASQLWMFIAPGLYRNEKEAFLPFLAATPILFFIGGAFAYFVVFPVAWSFFLSFQTPNGGGGVPIELLPKVGEYLDIGDEAAARLRHRLRDAGGADAAGPRRHPHQRHAGPGAPLRHRADVHRRRGPHAARRVQPVQPGPADDPALRDLDLPRAPCRRAKSDATRRRKRQNSDSATTRELDRVD